MTRAATAVIVAGSCALCLGCGGAKHKPPPTQRDVGAITAAVADIVYQCQSAAAGFVAGPDEAALRRDVDALVSAYGRVRADAPFRLPSSTGQARRTTLRDQAALAARNLSADCSAKQAARVQAAMK
jgi:hypothetical protein